MCRICIEIITRYDKYYTHSGHKQIKSRFCPSQLYLTIKYCLLLNSYIKSNPITKLEMYEDLVNDWEMFKH